MNFEMQMQGQEQTMTMQAACGLLAAAARDGLTLVKEEEEEERKELVDGGPPGWASWLTDAEQSAIAISTRAMKAMKTTIWLEPRSQIASRSETTMMTMILGEA